MAPSTRRGALRSGVSLIAAGLLVGSTGLVAAAAEEPGSTAEYGGNVYMYPNVERDGTAIRSGFDETTLKAGDVITDWTCWASAEDYSRDITGTYRVKIGDGSEYDETMDFADSGSYRPAANYVITDEDIARGYVEASCEFANFGFVDASERYNQTITSYLHVDAADDRPNIEATADIVLNDENGDGIANFGEVVSIAVDMENKSTSPTAISSDHDITMFDSVNDYPEMTAAGNEWLFPTPLEPGEGYSENWNYTVTRADERNKNLPNIRANYALTSRAGIGGTTTQFSPSFAVGPWADLAPDAADFTAANEGDVTLDADAAEAGSKVGLTILALDADEQFSAFLFDSAGDYVTLASEARYLDPSDLTIPAATTAGDYKVGVYQPNGVVLGWDSLTVSDSSGGVVTPNASDFTDDNQGGLTFYGDAQPAPGDAFQVEVEAAANGDAVVVYLFDEANQPRLLADVDSYDGAIDANYPADLATGDYVVGVYSAADGSVLGWDTRSVFDTTENPSVPIRFTVWPAADGVELAWEKPLIDGNAVTGYYIEYVAYDDGVSDWTRFDEVQGGDMTSYTTNSLTEGHDYAFRVGPMTVNGDDPDVTYSRTRTAGFGDQCDEVTHGNSVIDVTLSACDWDGYGLGFDASDISVTDAGQMPAGVPAGASDNILAVNVNPYLPGHGTTMSTVNTFNADVENAYVYDYSNDVWVDSWDGMDINGDTVSFDVTDGKFPNRVSDRGVHEYTNSWGEYLLLVDFGASTDVPVGDYEPDVHDFTDMNKYGIEITQGGTEVTEVKETEEFTAEVTAYTTGDSFDLWALSTDGAKQKVIAKDLDAADAVATYSFAEGLAGDWAIAAYDSFGSPVSWMPLAVTGEQDVTGPSEGDLTDDNFVGDEITVSPTTATAGENISIDPGNLFTSNYSVYIFAADGENVMLGSGFKFDEVANVTIPLFAATGEYRLALTDGVNTVWRSIDVVANDFKGDITVPRTVTAGGTLKVGTSLAPGTKVEGFITAEENYDPDKIAETRDLGLATIASDGSAIFTVPSDVPVGTQRFILYEDAEPAGSLVGWDTVTVLAPEKPDVVKPSNPSEDDLTADTQGKIRATPSTFKPGDRVTVKVAGASEGEYYSVVIFSEPTDLGTYQTDANGQFAVSTPSNLEEGVHSIAVYDADGNVVGWQTVTVSAQAGAATEVDNEVDADADASGSSSGDENASAQDGSLAETGASDLSATLALGAGILILVGMSLTGFALVGRRKA